MSRMSRLKRLQAAESNARRSDSPKGMAGWYALTVEQRDAGFYPERQVEDDDAD